MWILYSDITGGSLRCFLTLCSEDHLSDVRHRSVTEYWDHNLEIPPTSLSRVENISL